MKFRDFKQAADFYTDHTLYAGAEVDTGHWQGVTTEGHPDLVTKEILDVKFHVPIHKEWGEDKNPWTNDLARLQHEIQPNLPWADDHFEERVSRVPSNPGEQYKNWPWWQGQTAVTAASMIDPGHREFAPANFKFDHTYQERYWPKSAGWENLTEEDREGLVRMGIRYFYGDLDDLVGLLYSKPYTRQAWLPIFYPEDTGAVHEGRVPCTLGYQFMLRDGKLHMWYIIRSCDVVRHFRDDLYLSARLLLWVLEQLREEELRDDKEQIWVDVQPGTFYFHCFSLHYHKGDEHHLHKH